MLLCIGSILSDSQLNEVKGLLANQPFDDGSRTAGWAAQGVKRNLQLAPSARNAAKLQSLLNKALAGNAVFTAAAAPRSIRPLLISRYEAGMGYGDHVDNAMMDGTRTDLSFTLFLNEPSSYEGGELVVEEPSGTRAIKLAAGSAVLYPSGYLHRVDTVTSGERIVAVGWLQSLVRRADQRQILFELETLRQHLFQRDGKNEAFDTLSRSTSNLWRMWAEP